MNKGNEGMTFIQEFIFTGTCGFFFPLGTLFLLEAMSIKNYLIMTVIWVYLFRYYRLTN